MPGRKDRNFKIHTAVSLENLVPVDKFYRQIEDHLDLGFVRELAHSLYSRMGLPPIDRVVHHSIIIEFGKEVSSLRAEETARRSIDFCLKA